MKLTPNFRYEEFECPCLECAADTTRRVPIIGALVVKLQEVRNILDRPMTINSGVRCYTHNVAVQGKPGSSHLLGLAADVAVNGSREKFELLEAAFEVGFLRIGGSYETFVHLDVDPHKDEKVFW